MHPISLDAHGIAVLVLTVVALFLFTRDRIPLESSSLTILIILIAGFELFPYERGGEVLLKPVDFFAGFGSEALVAICALMMVGKALETTGALQPLATIVSRAWSKNPVLALLATLLAGAVLSAFMNNTPIVVLLMPILVGASLRSKFPVSKVMMPMGLATIIGGMSTTIGTSTNLLVVGIAHDMGQHSFSIFEWVLPVALVGGVALIFLWLVAPRLLPDRTPLMADTTPRIFSGQLHVKEGGFADGKTLSQVIKKTDGQIRVEKIQRSESLFLAKLPQVKIQPGDRLFVKDSPENLKHYEQVLGVTLYNISDVEHPVDDEFPLEASGQQLAEVVVTRGSPLHLRTLAAASFSGSYGLMPLALHRARAPSSQVTGDLNTIRLRAGDVLLVQGTGEAISNLEGQRLDARARRHYQPAAYAQGEACAGRHGARRGRGGARYPADLGCRRRRTRANDCDGLPELARSRRRTVNSRHHDHRDESRARQGTHGHRHGGLPCHELCRHDVGVADGDDPERIPVADGGADQRRIE